jgi:transposase
MQIHSVVIDLGKTTFHLVALGAAGKVLARKKFTQRQLLTYTANMQTSLIGLEACSGAHFLGRVLRKQGHDVRLIAAQFVKPFVKSNKNDFVDAEAIAEAVERKNMRFVPIKTDDQLDLQAIHRVRDRLISRRTLPLSTVMLSGKLPRSALALPWPGLPSSLSLLGPLPALRIPA